MNLTGLDDFTVTRVLAGKPILSSTAEKVLRALKAQAATAVSSRSHQARIPRGRSTLMAWWDQLLGGFDPRNRPAGANLTALTALTDGRRQGRPLPFGIGGPRSFFDYGDLGFSRGGRQPSEGDPTIDPNAQHKNTQQCTTARRKRRRRLSK